MTDHSVGMWERMRRNAAENAPRFVELRLERDKLPVIDCRECGTAESALFWSLREVAGSNLHLNCPTCESYGVRYHAARRQLVHSRSRRGKLGTATEAVAALTLILVIGFGGHVAANGGLTRHNWSVKSAEAQRQITRQMGSAANRLAPGHASAGFALPNRLAAASRGGEAVYFAAGAQQAAIRSFARELDPGDAQLLRSALYLPEEDLTRVILAGDSRAWRSYLARCGWNASALVDSAVPAGRMTEARCFP
jgi:hypothetical protein